jgi:hypothetical protein
MIKEPEQLDLFKKSESALPATAVVISALPYIARRMWRERMLALPNNPGEVVELQSSRRLA